MGRRAFVLALACSLAAGAVSCQAILGFEELSASGGAAGGSAAGGSGSDGSDGSDGTGGESGSIEGAACDRTEECRGELVCIYGRCRSRCTGETECAGGSLCLFSGTLGGCRLSGEVACQAERCDNVELVCGLDATCRVACSETRSCDSSTQRCVAGSCVSTVGADGALFDCGGKAEGDVLCDGAKLGVCNVLQPGVGTIATCASAGICQESLPADGRYDSSAPPTCVTGCSPGKRFCSGDTLHECKQDGSGSVDGGQVCATPDLCAKAVADLRTDCPSPACAVGEKRCSGGQTDLNADACNAGRTAFEAQDRCDVASLRCNPATGTCLDLAVDETEVTTAEYATWLATTPPTDLQAAGCAFNTSFEREAACLGSAECTGTPGECPVVCVDWCDASAYCEAQGRRLCGKIGGGMVPFAEFGDPGKSEWTNACSGGGQFVYGHGNSVPETDPKACVYAGNSGGTAYAAGSRSACHSPARGYASLEDLSGNVAEWEDSCEKAATDDAASGSDACRTRGGSYDSSEQLLRCSSAPTVPLLRSSVSPFVGIRCCGG